MSTGALTIGRRSVGMRGRHTNRRALRLSRGWLTWRWGLVRVLGEPEEITPEYLKCCFVLVLIDLARAICWLISQGFDPIATIDEQMERGERLWHNS